MRKVLGISRKLVAVAVVVIAASGCDAGEEAIVTVKRTIMPAKGLPAGLTQVAVLPAECGSATDAKWSDMTSDLICGLIEQSRSKFGTNLRIADRVETKKVFQEADLSASGLTQGGANGAPAELLAVQAFIISKVNLKTSQTKSSKTVISGLGGLGGLRHGHIGGGASTSEHEKINQTITAQVKFQLVDAKTGETWMAHEDSVQSNEETDPGMFMGIGGHSDLSTEDEIAGVLIERVAREFMAKLLPIEVENQVEVKSGHGKASKEAVGQLRADMYAEALDNFRIAIADDPKDDRSLFGAGVACEAMGNRSEALEYYKKACAAKGRDEYIEAKNRLSSGG